MEEEKESVFVELADVISTLHADLRERRGKSTRCWTHSLLQKRTEHGAFYHLVQEPTSKNVWLFRDLTAASTRLATQESLYMVRFVCDLYLAQTHIIIETLLYLSEPERFFLYADADAHVDPGAYKETRL